MIANTTIYHQVIYINLYHICTHYRLINIQKNTMASTFHHRHQYYHCPDSYPDLSYPERTTSIAWVVLPHAVYAFDVYADDIYCSRNSYSLAPDICGVYLEHVRNGAAGEPIILRWTPSDCVAIPRRPERPNEKVCYSHNPKEQQMSVLDIFQSYHTKLVQYKSNLRHVFSTVEFAMYEVLLLNFNCKRKVDTWFWKYHNEHLSGLKRCLSWKNKKTQKQL